MAGDISIDRFPTLSSDWLGELPNIAEAATEKRKLKESLANLDSSNPESLRAAGNRAIATGSTAGIEAGVRLHNLAQAREALASQTNLYQQYIAPTMAAILGGKGGIGTVAPALPGTEGSPSVGFGRRGAESAPPAEVDPFAGAPGTIPPPTLPSPMSPAGKVEEGFGALKSYAPMEPKSVPTVSVPPSLNLPPVGPSPETLGPRTELSPTEQVLAQAEGQIPAAPAAGPQLAGPAPAPGPAAAPAPVPDWLAGGAQALQPSTAPAAPKAAAEAKALGAPVSGTTDPATLARINEIAAGMVRLGPKASPSQREALSQLYRSEISKTAWTPEFKNYHIDQADRFAAGEPTQTIADWRKDQKLDITRAEDALKIYSKDYRVEGQKAAAVRDNIDQLRTIMHDPSFATTGFGTPLFDTAQKQLASLAGSLRAIGVPAPSEETISGLTRPAALREAFGALTNQSVISMLGGLGAGRSDKDVFVSRSTVPQLTNTPKGNELIIEFMDKVASRKEQAAQVARDYLETKKNRATTYGLDEAVNQANARFRENGILMDKEGKLTDLGQRMKAEADKATAGPGRAPFPFSGDKVLTGPAAQGDTGRQLIGSADYYRPPAQPAGIGAAPLPYDPTEAMTGAAGPAPPIGLAGLLSRFGPRAVQAPVANQSELMAKNEGRRVTIAGEKFIVKDGRLQPLIEGE